MTHNFIHTDAFVLSKNVYKESDAIVKLFTKDLGIVYAIVRGGYKEESKLSSSIQKYDYVNVSLVNGRKFIVLDSKVKDPLYSIKNKKEKFISLINVLIVIYYFGGEEESFEIFNVLEEYIEVLKNTKEVKLVEYATAIKIISMLGWSDLNIELSKIMSFMSQRKENYKGIVDKINQAFSETGLRKNSIISA